MNKYKYMIVLILLILLISSFFCFFYVPLLYAIDKDTENDIHGAIETLTVWCFDPSIIDACEYYKKNNPNIDFKYISVSTTEYTGKLNIALGLSNQIPDICMLERDIRADLLNLDIWEEFDGFPYYFEESNIPDYIVDSVKKDSKILSLPYDISIAGLAYRKSIMESIFSQEVDMQTLFSDWDSTLAFSEEMKKQNNNFYLFSSMDNFAIILFNQTTLAYVKDGKVIEPSRFYENFKLVEKAVKLNIIDVHDNWSPRWYESLEDPNYFFYPFATWMIQYNLFTSKNNQGKSDWGIMVPPNGSFVWGGTSLSIPKNSKHKNTAYDFIFWITNTIDGAYYSKNSKSNIFNHNKQAYLDPDFISLYKDDFGDLNLGDEFFNKLIRQMYIRDIGDHDDIIKDYFLFLSNRMLRDKDIDAKEAYELMIQFLNINSKFAVEV